MRRFRRLRSIHHTGSTDGNPEQSGDAHEIVQIGPSAAPALPDRPESLPAHERRVDNDAGH